MPVSENNRAFRAFRLDATFCAVYALGVLLAQSDRASASGAEGPWFDPTIGRHMPG